MEIETTLQDHSKELEQARRLIAKADKDYKYFKELGQEIPTTKKKKLIYIVSTVLDAIGEMSLTRQAVRNKMEEDYTQKYLQSPELGKNLFLTEYEKIHKPYDKLKNKCFDLLFKIDPDNEIILE